MKSAPNQLHEMKDRFAEADSRANALQGQLASNQEIGLKITMAIIFSLALSAFAARMPSLQVLCPVAVFLMIQYLGHLRNSKSTFKFVSARLTAETLRVMFASQGKHQLLNMIVSTRSMSTHPVAEESVRASESFCDLQKQGSSYEATGKAVNTDFWDKWLEEQTAYYASASSRERQLGKRGVWIFNSAFSLVALVGLGASFWTIFDPSAAGSESFRALMAFASFIGSCGLAYINFVKDRKAFDQSFDYDHMYQVLAGNINPRAKTLEGDVFERLVVSESLNENMRWALRMAGHFKALPTDAGQSSR
jgi:hypothetical protein